MKKIIFLLALVVIFSSICFAQDNKSEDGKLFYTGLQYYGKGDFLSAQDYFEKSLIIAKKTGNKRGMAFNLGMLGDIQQQLIGDKEAMGYYAEALKIAEEIGFKKGIVMQLLCLAEILGSELLDYEKTLEYSNRALELSSEVNFKKGEADALRIIAVIHGKRGNFNKALEYYKEAVRIYKEIDDQKGVADAFNGLAEVYYILNDNKKVLEYNLESLKICRTIGDKPGIARALGNVGTIYMKMGEHTKAFEYYKDALDIDNNRRVSAIISGNFAAIYFLIKDYPQALEYCKNAIALCREGKDPTDIAFNIGNISLVYYNMGNYSKALEQAKESLAITTVLNIPDQIWRTNGIMGSIYEKMNDNKTALSYYKASIDTLESIRGKLKLEEHKLSFIEDKMTVYEQIVLLLLKLNKKEEAFDYAERAKSRALLDLLANRVKPKQDKELSQEEIELNAKINTLLGRMGKESSKPEKQQSRTAVAQTSQELQNLRTRHQEVISALRQKDPEFASLISVEPLKSAEAQKLLDKDTTLLEYYLTKEKLFIWIITQENLGVVEIPLTEKELVTKIEALRKSIEERTNDYKEISSQLYKILITPAKPYITTSKLYIVPHKALHYLPYACLMDKDKFLIEEYSLAYSPNASVLKFCFEKRKQGKANLLAFGNPDNSLSYAEDEVNQIKKDFSKAEVFIKENATETKVKALANNYQILHFACHGELNPFNPLYSNLRLASDSKEDGRLEAWEIYDLNLNNASLVTLSACSTALGNITNGDEIIGLTRGFIYAGSPSIVASLWNVDDKSTSILMQDFYKNLKNNSKAESLRLAQLKLIKDKIKPDSEQRGTKTLKQEATVDSSHPFYWAAFELIGDRE